MLDVLGWILFILMVIALFSLQYKGTKFISTIGISIVETFIIDIIFALISEVLFDKSLYKNIADCFMAIIFIAGCFWYKKNSSSSKNSSSQDDLSYQLKKELQRMFDSFASKNIEYWPVGLINVDDVRSHVRDIVPDAKYIGIINRISDCNVSYTNGIHLNCVSFTFYYASDCKQILYATQTYRSFTFMQKAFDGDNNTIISYNLSSDYTPFLPNKEFNIVDPTFYESPQLVNQKHITEFTCSDVVYDNDTNNDLDNKKAYMRLNHMLAYVTNNEMIFDPEALIEWIDMNRQD